MSSKESIIGGLTAKQREMVVERLAEFLYKQNKKKEALEKLSKI